MTLEKFIEKLRNIPAKVIFQDTMDTIDTLYDFSPVSFSNGTITNKAGENNGSCKLFHFAKLHKLTQEETLYCFGEHYKNVLDTPTATNHQNIRNFMKTGWDGISFEDQALTKKSL